jgi:hypothetical protein
VSFAVLLLPAHGCLEHGYSIEVLTPDLVVLRVVEQVPRHFSLLVAWYQRNLRQHHLKTDFSPVLTRSLPLQRLLALRFGLQLALGLPRAEEAAAEVAGFALRLAGVVLQHYRLVTLHRLPG